MDDEVAGGRSAGDDEERTTVRTIVAGVDSSTQSCKVVYVDADTGELLDLRTAAHPDGTSVDPQAWWTALRSVLHTDGVAAVAVAGQQHGLVTVDNEGRCVRDALLWNDLRSAPQARRLNAELGENVWRADVGSSLLASITVTKLAWLAENEPAAADRVAAAMLPHDWLTWRLRGGGVGAGDVEPTTDRSDASGTGYYSPVQNRYLPDKVELAFGRVPRLPRVLGPHEPAGRTPDGVLVGPGAGDNAAAALGLAAAPGEVVVSLGTSGAVFAQSAAARPAPALNLFADAAGGLLPLACTLNAARVLTAGARLLGVELEDWERLSAEAPVDAGGLVLLPYLDGERTPDLPQATGSLHGLTRETMTPPHVARAVLLGMLCGLADALDVVRAAGVAAESVLLVGGAARSAAVQTAAADVFGLPVKVPEPAEYVALGAARQAAWTLRGGAEPPAWPRPLSTVREPSGQDWPGRVRARYRQARDRLYS